MNIIRGIVQSVVEGVVKRFSATGRWNETITDRECVQHYGFTSRALRGAELFFLSMNNIIISLGEEDRRYRIAIENGEVCIYSDEGDHIRLKRGKEIYIESGNKLTAVVENEVDVTTKVANVNASDRVTVTSPNVNVVASTKITCTTPEMEVTGNVRVGGGIWAGTGSGGGNVTASGNVTATGDVHAGGNVSDGVRSIAGDRWLYNIHKHMENGAGHLTNVPDQQE